jgi:hypothetical protein
MLFFKVKCIKITYNFNILKFIYDINILKNIKIIKKILLSKNKFNLKKILGTQFRAAPKLDDGTSLFFFLFCSFSSKKKKNSMDFDEFHKLFCS